MASKQKRQICCGENGCGNKTEKQSGTVVRRLVPPGFRIPALPLLAV